MSAALHAFPPLDMAVAVDGLLGPAIADELVEASRLLGELAFDLGSDPSTLRRHMASLQQIDRVTQIQLVLADLLRSGGGLADRIAAVPLEEVQDRLRRATDLT